MLLSFAIVAQLDSLHAAQIQKNQESIISTVELCGRQGIGHRDDGKHLDDSENNFQALLKFRCGAGDNVLADHFTACARNAT